jgi:uncharacterized membrane protein YhaH (DUF805 family)
MSIQPGWYNAEGDPPNTVRYWDGNTWQGGPQPEQTNTAQLTNEPARDPFAPTPADQVSEPVTPAPAVGDNPIQGLHQPAAQSGAIAPGWYPAAGDPPNTIRYWNGTTWEGGPQTPPGFGGAGFSAPMASLSPIDYVKRAYTEHYANFSGRARRAEFGWFILSVWLLSFILSTLGEVSGVFSLITGIFWLGTIVPYLAVAVRRLHDMNLSGWMMLIALIPLINFIFFLVVIFSDSSRAANKWGPSPKYG